MVTPIVLAVGAVLLARDRFAAAQPIRAVWLLLPILGATVLAARLQANGGVDDALVNRLLALLVLAGCVAFVVLNRAQPSGLVRAGIWLTAVGAACNALATVIYGYMPVLAASARWLGWDVGTGDHPNPQYVGAHAAQLPALLLGDVLPVPAIGLVVSLGDLLLIPGCVLLLASFLALTFSPDVARRPTAERG